MQKAGESDQGVLRRLSEHEAAFAGLTVEAAAAQMPRLQASAGMGTSGSCCEDGQGRTRDSDMEMGNACSVLHATCCMLHIVSFQLM